MHSQPPGRGLDVQQRVRDLPLQHLQVQGHLPKPGYTEGERGSRHEKRELGAPLSLGEWS